MSVAVVPGAVIADGVAAARGQMRFPAGEDALLARLVESALLLGEAFTGRLFVRRAVVEAASGGGWRVLALPDVFAIEAVVDGGGEPLPAEAYAIDIDGAGAGWVRADRAVRVSYVAGLAEGWDTLPAPIAQGVAMLAAHLFEDRGGGAPPAAVTALWRPWRRVRLAVEARA